jgi:outer membrane protein assembly factor BamB
MGRGLAREGGYGRHDRCPVPGTLISGEKGQFYLRALDMKNGKLRWEFPMPGPTPMWAGTLSTAGGLVFSADDDGDLVGLDARSGKAL